MLRELHISNFAIIENQSISFAEGLNVITGETGSGKSIILSALDLILGGRSSTTSIRAGADALEVQALFDLSDVPAEVSQALPDIARTEELVVSRSLSTSGKGKTFVNGNLATVSLLAEIGQRLISICGQSQHVRLLEPSYHLALLDGYAKNEGILREYREVYAAWRHAVERLHAVSGDAVRRQERERDLQGIVDELEPLGPRAGLREELEISVRRLSNASRVTDGLQELVATLSEADGAIEMLRRISARASEIERLDPAFRDVAALAASARTELIEFERESSRYLASVESDESELEVLSQRLAEMARVERKYRRSDAALEVLLRDAKEELGCVEGEGALDKLRADVAKLEEQASGIAERLSQDRARIADKLARTVAAELKELNMAGAKLSFRIEHGDLGPMGKDRVEFLMATNAGEPAKPLKLIASGGELSRIMLVLKKVLKERSGVNVLVFDEVDTGVSGSVARAVGEKLSALSEQSQVICITHLAQVASFADHHLLVGKTSGKRTVSTIREISGDERIDEIARMLAGYTITAATRESARELLSSKLG